jgi:hypothetical protein
MAGILRCNGSFSAEKQPRMFRLRFTPLKVTTLFLFPEASVTDIFRREALLYLIVRHSGLIICKLEGFILQQ